MDRIKVIVGILIMIALAGLPCWACRRRDLMMGWLRYIYGGKEDEENCISG